ncbi:MAG TPA: phosphatidate cytidylyltransferase [Turneriella sp.]|nr:phosphatidate cytidylyltransferase [Turneriella sp.]
MRKHLLSRMGETTKRIITGVLIAAAFIFTITYQGAYMVFLYAFVLAAAIIGVRELYKLAEAKIQQRISSRLAIASTVIMLTLVYVGWQAQYYVDGAPLFNASVQKVLAILKLNYAFLGGLLFVFLFFILFFQLLKNHVENSFFIIGLFVLAVFYLPFTFSHLFLLYGLENGLFYIWMVAWATAMADTGGYFMGRAFGRHKVGFAVSPNKTYEGYILGGVLQNILVHIFYYIARTNFNVPQYGVIEITLFGMIIYLASIVGDLAESLLKRDAGIKDSSHLIPGHGGVLDLLDAMLITIPAAYYYFYIVQELHRL